MPTRMWSGCVAFTAALAALCGSASSPAAETPSDPREALAFYEGTWKVVNSNDKERESVRETCSWLATKKPRQHIVCRSTKETVEGLKESLGIYSYDETSKEYLCFSFYSDGIYTERGERIPNGFRFHSERLEGAKKVQVRFTIVEGTGGHVNTLTETAEPGGPWTVEEKLEYLRSRP